MSGGSAAGRRATFLSSTLPDSEIVAARARWAAVDAFSFDDPWFAWSNKPVPNTAVSQARAAPSTDCSVICPVADAAESEATEGGRKGRPPR